MNIVNKTQIKFGFIRSLNYVFVIGLNLSKERIRFDSHLLCDALQFQIFVPRSRSKVAIVLAKTFFSLGIYTNLV